MLPPYTIPELKNTIKKLETFTRQILHMQAVEFLWLDNMHWPCYNITTQKVEISTKYDKYTFWDAFFYH